MDGKRRSDRIYVKLKSGEEIIFATSASAEYIVDRLRTMLVGTTRGIHQTIHVIPKGQIKIGGVGVHGVSGG